MGFGYDNSMSCGLIKKNGDLGVYSLTFDVLLVGSRNVFCSDNIVN